MSPVRVRVWKAFAAVPALPGIRQYEDGILMLFGIDRGTVYERGQLQI